MNYKIYAHCETLYQCDYLGAITIYFINKNINDLQHSYSAIIPLNQIRFTIYLYYIMTDFQSDVPCLNFESKIVKE